MRKQIRRQVTSRHLFLNAWYDNLVFAKVGLASPASETLCGFEHSYVIVEASWPFAKKVPKSGQEQVKRCIRESLQTGGTDFDSLRRGELYSCARSPGLIAESCFARRSPLSQTG